MDSQHDITIVRASWLLAFDGKDHRLIEGGTLVYDGDTIRFVGKAYDGPSTRTIDAAGKLVVPGLISALTRVDAGHGEALIIDAGRRELLRTGFPSHMPADRNRGAAFADGIDHEASIRCGLGLLLRHGVTTVVEAGGCRFDGGHTLVRCASEAGIRLYYGPSYSTGLSGADRTGRIRQVTDEAAALAEFDAAVDFISRYDGTSEGRFKGMLTPSAPPSAPPTLLERTVDAADRLGVGIALTLGEEVYDFQRTLRYTGRTPVQLLHEAGVLRRGTILGHCYHIGGTSQVAYPYDDDIRMLARSGAVVAHAPVAGMRRGIRLESFQRFLDSGIDLAMSTDAYPFDMITEMQAASVVGKIVDRSVEAAAAADVLRAATLGGARAVGRADLGRLAVGAKADFAVVDLSNLRVGPVYDPIRSLLHAADGLNVDRVVVDGRTVVKDGVFLPWDLHAAAGRMRADVATVRANLSKSHGSSKAMDDDFPASFPPWPDHEKCSES